MFGKPILLTGKYVDMPLSFEHIAAVAALAPPERPTLSAKRSRQKSGSVIDRARQYLGTIDPAVSGQHGHDATYRAACVLVVDFDLSIDDARPLLQEFNARCQPPWDEDDLEHKLLSADKSSGERGRLATSSMFPTREISPLDLTLNSFEPFTQQDSLHDGFDPETILLPSADDGPLIDESDPLAGFGFADFESSTDLALDDTPLPLNTVPMDWMRPQVQEGRTDIANGKRLARIAHGLAHYIPAWDSWIVWDGRRWRHDDLGIREFAKNVPSTILADAMAVTPVDMAACAWGIASASKGRIDAAIAMCKSEPGIAIDHQQLDADPWLLNCLNGTVDLRTGEIHPHNQENLITRLCPISYDPDAESYDWDRFLESVLQSESLIGCVQRLFGYCATGSTREQILPIFWGKGSNGKTTLVETFMKVLGDDYTSQAPKSLLIASKYGDNHPCDQALLHGKRFALGSESEDGQRLNEALVKSLTGGDKIVARRMREDFWTFTPTHKLALMTNHKPRIKGTDYGIWRRLVMIPFSQKFWNPAKGETGPEELRRDETLGDRLHQCMPGILAWIVRGAIEWHKSGLQLSPEILAATREYQTSQDVLGRFIEECCNVKQPDIKCRFGALYDQLKSWCDGVGESCPSRRAVGDWLVANEFTRHPSNGETWYFGVEIRPDCDQKNTFDDF